MPEEIPTDELALEGSSEFFGDSGPAFSADNSPDAPDPLETEVLLDDVGWTADGVAEFLRSIQAPAFNAMLNPLLGVEEVDWSHRDKRLEQVAPAIAREWNKMPKVRALAGHTDRGLILSYLILEYLGPRTFAVVAERRAKAEEEDAPEPYTDAGYPQADDPDTDFQPRIFGLPPRRR